MATEWDKGRNASILTLNFSKAPDIRQHPSGNLQDPGNGDLRARTAEGKLLTPKQIRARARRRVQRGGRRKTAAVTQQEFEALYKPIEEWDLQELAKGRPRDSNGKFGGKAPGWITREVHEKAMEQFTMAIKSEMNSLTPTAVDTLRYVLENEEVDDRGKPIIPASAKNQASMFLLEHLVGKPTQKIEQDISVKLQAILGTAMVNPNSALAPIEQGGVGGYELAHFPGQTIPFGDEADVVEADWVDDDSDLDGDGE